MTDDPKPVTASGEMTDWTYATIVEPEGLCVYGVEHDGHVFADHVGLIKTYATHVDTSGSTFVPIDLGTEGMKVGKQPYIDKVPARSPDFYYLASHSIYAPFRINNVAGSDQRLGGVQRFSFTETSDTPRHETAQVAAAGRFYPDLHFAVSPQTDEDQGAIESLRFDFQIKPDVGPGGRRESSAFIPGELTFDNIIESLFGEDIAKQVPQQAGMFRDRDHSLLHRALFAGWRPGEQVFEAAEKPLLWEIATSGIIEGGTRGWDNIHVWGYHPSGVVSTPGMPYGMHLHWRWSAGTTNRLSMIMGDWTPDFARAPELAGRDINGNMVPGGPLIDPRNPLTDLRIAVVKKATADAYTALTPDGHDDFVGMFKKIKAKPADIEDGDEIVIIISIVVHRKDRTKRWRGTVFPHGLFFPHAYDVGYLAENALTQAGAYNPQYLDRKPAIRRWERDPN